MKKSIRTRKNKLVKSTTFFMALFVTAIMLLGSVVPAAVNPDTSVEVKEKVPLFSTESEVSRSKTANRIMLTNELPGTSQEKSATQPLDRDITWIHYNDDTAENSLGLTAGGNWKIANRFTPDELGDYAGYGLTTVQFYFGWSSAPPDMDINVIIYGEGSSTSPGDILYTEGFTASGLGWNTFTLETPQPIGGDADRWVAIEFVNQPAGSYPAGMSEGATAGKGDWLYLSSWVEATVYGFNYDFMIWAGVEEGGPVVEHDMRMKSIDAPVSGTAADPIVPKATVKNNGNNTETNVNVSFEIAQTALTSVFYEGFEGTWPPSGWTIYEDLTYGGYIIQSTGGYVGTYAMKMYCNNYNYPFVEADTSTFDGSGGNNILTFWHKQLAWAGDQDYLYVYVYNGMTYSYVTGYFSSMDWTYETINLDNYITPTSTMQIWFAGSLGYGYGIYLDEVEVNSLALTTVYSDTKQIASIAPGAETQVAFADWTPAEWGNPAYQDSTVSYAAEAEVMLVGDEDPGNDAKDSTFNLYFPFMNDVEVTTIIEPVDDAMAQTFDVKAKIKNVGQNKVKDFFTEVNIGEIFVGPAFYTENMGTSQTYYPPTGWLDEHDAAYGYTYGWRRSTSTLPGGTSPCIYLYYYYTRANMKLISPTIDMSGKTGGLLNYKLYVNHYSGQGLYSYNVGVSTDNGATWTKILELEPGSSGLYPGEVGIPGGSATTKIAFWIEGDPFYFNYIYMDDVTIKETDVISEYEWNQAVVDWFYPGEEIEQTFQDWTPDHLLTSDESGVFKYGITAETLLPGDDNPDNDAKGDDFQLTFTHDIGIAITSPARSEGTWYIADALGYNVGWFDPATPGTFNVIAPYSTSFISAGCWAQGQWYASTYGTGTIYTIDTTTGAMTMIGGSLSYGFTGIGYFAGQLYGCAWTGSANNLYAIDIATGTNTLIGSGGYYLVIDMAIASDGTCYGHDIIADQIVKIDLATGAITVVGVTGIYANYAQGASYDYGADVMYLAAYTTSAQLYSVDTTTGLCTLIGNFPSGTEMDGFAIPGSSQGPPTPTVFVKKGTTGSITATGTNYGTWEETSDAYGIINEFVTDPNNGTFVDDWTVPDVTLDPLGGTETITFGTMSWALEGVYSLYVELPLGLDDKQSNNAKTLGIGSDGTPPVSSYTITPASPDGLNSWYVSDVTVKLTATDPEINGVKSGVDHIEYQVDGGSWQNYPGSAGFKVTTDSANHVVKYRAVDKVGNVEAEKTIPSFKIDKTKPVIAMNYTSEKIGMNQYQIIVTVTSTDAMSGMDRVEFYFNDALQATVSGAGPTYVWNYTWAPLPHVTIKAIAYDNAGLNIFDTIEDPTESATILQQTQPVIKIL